MTITLDKLRDLLDLDPETGILTNKHNSRGRKQGHRVGHLMATGYRRITIDSIVYIEHRLIWFHYYGNWPDSDLDHINRNKEDNSIKNLREATKRENSLNREVPLPIGLLYRGIRQVSENSGFRAEIRNGDDKEYLGTYTTDIAASIVFEKRAKELHGYSYIDPKYLYDINTPIIKVTQSTNAKVGISGYAGVTPSAGKFQARIKIDGRTVVIGRFTTALEAHEAFLSKKLEIGRT